LLPRSYSAPSFPMCPLEFRAEVNRQETRVMGLSSSEDYMIVAGVVLAWYQRVTDGQTDGRTETIIAKTALCIASYADALSKSDYTDWEAVQLCLANDIITLQKSIRITLKSWTWQLEEVRIPKGVLDCWLKSADSDRTSLRADR